jgi:hypothetical protein
VAATTNEQRGSRFGPWLQVRIDEAADGTRRTCLDRTATTTREHLQGLGQLVNTLPAGRELITERAILTVLPPGTDAESDLSR